MKILTIVSNLDKGGTQRAAQTFAEAYYELKHDSKVLSLYGLGPRYEEIKEFIEVWNGLSTENLKQIKAWEPEIIHIHSHGPKKVDIDRLLQNITTKRVVIETNVFSKPSPWANQVDISYQLSRWALWVFNLRGGSKFRSAIVPYPVKCHSFKKVEVNQIKNFRKKYNISQDAFVIGRIGQSDPGKWSPMLIDIFNELARDIDNLYLLIINCPDNILKLSASSPFKNKIIHISKIIGDKELSCAYSAMDVMVHIAEIGESFGMVLPESILCETPVVALSTPWADNSQCEVVGNNIGGFIAHRKTGIIKAIRKLYKNILVVNKNCIFKNYDHINVAERAIELALLKKKNRLSDRKKNGNINEILKNSIDKPNILTSFFIWTDLYYMRQLTKYSSGYADWSELLKLVKEKIRKKFVKT